MNYEENIGRQVTKGHISTGESNRKKFKSGLYINTIMGVINHPILNIPAYTFEEDDSYVECRRCFLYTPTHEVVDLVYHDDENNIAFEGTVQECHDWNVEQGFGYQVRPKIKK